jgi:hypothetical protein
MGIIIRLLYVTANRYDQRDIAQILNEHGVVLSSVKEWIHVIFMEPLDAHKSFLI